LLAASSAQLFFLLLFLQLRASMNALKSIPTTSLLLAGVYGTADLGLVMNGSFGLEALIFSRVRTFLSGLFSVWVTVNLFNSYLN
jgi:hypothetical protein